MKRLIITGDDFGLSLKINEAIEEAHRQGVLTTASLIVGTSATADAVDRAKRLPSLKVGLHVVLIDGTPTLSPREIPDLVDERGLFSHHPVRAGIHFFIRSRVRKQVEAEMEAQFRAFERTGLPLDHVNAHHHMHLHPTLADILVRVGKGSGVKAVRLPDEPFLLSWRVSRQGFLRRLANWLFLLPWVVCLRRRLKHDHIHSNQWIFGMNDSGRIHPELFLSLLHHLPEGSTEVCFHPGENPEEMEALTSPRVKQALSASNIETLTFSDL